MTEAQDSRDDQPVLLWGDEGVVAGDHPSPARRTPLGLAAPAAALAALTAWPAMAPAVAWLGNALP